LILLVDSQLPPALAHHLRARGISSIHVRDLGLDSATDLEIWEYAKSHGMTIVSKDQDFNNFAMAKGTPPQVIWVRLGNCRRADLFAAIDRRLTAIQGMLVAGLAVIELH
jgi:predicted nuclease of predicted toxin-antitoxin system